MQLFSLIVSLILAAIFCSIGIFAGCFAYRNKHSKTSWLQGYSVTVMFYFITCETVCTAVAKFKNVDGETVIQNVMPIFTLLAIAAAGVFIAGLVIEYREIKSKSKNKPKLSKEETAEIFNQEYQAQWPTPDAKLDSNQQSADDFIAGISKTAQEISDYIDAWYIAEMANIERVFQKNKFVPEFAAEETAKESAEETSKETVVVP